MTKKESLYRKLQNKRYREEFVSSYIDVGVPFQIRAMRDQRKLSQRALGALLSPRTSQEGISRMENPKYGLNLGTLKRIAAALDVALIVRFVPFSELARWVGGLSEGALEVSDFDHDAGFVWTGAELPSDAIGSTAIFEDWLSLADRGVTGGTDAAINETLKDVA